MRALFVLLSLAACASAYQDLHATLVQRVEQLFATSENTPVQMTRHGIRVRSQFDGDHMTSFSEAQVDEDPDEFLHFLENFNEAFPKVNPMAERVQALTPSDGVRQGLRVFLKFPFPLQGRVMVHYKYLTTREPNEHLLIFSEQGNEELLQRYYSEDDSVHKDRVLARTFVSAYWIAPHPSGRGSTVRYAFCGDTGGVIPGWIQRMVGPQTAYDSIDGLLKFVRKGAAVPKRR